MTIHPLTIKNFFKHYIVSPGNEKLSPDDQKIAKICSAVLGVCSLGTVHFGVGIYRLCRFIYKVLKDNGVDKISTISSVASETLNIMEPKKADPMKKKAAPKPKTPIEVLNGFAQAFGKKAVELEGPYAVKGIPNLGNTCYFNAALQNLEAIIHSQPAGEQLLHSDLSLQKGETVEGIEKRLLHVFYPIEEPKIDEKVIPDSNMDEEAYQVFRDRTLKSRKEMAWPAYERHLQLKWSLLVLFQVKQFGSEEQLKMALEAHRDLFFDKEDNDFKKENRYKQLDTADYMRVILEALRLNIPVETHVKKGNEEPRVKESVNELLVLRPLFRPREPEPFSRLLSKAFMVEEVEKENEQQLYVHRQYIRLNGNPPPVMALRINRNFSALVKQEVVVNEMVPVQEGKITLLKKQETKRTLQPVNQPAKNNAEIVFDLDPYKIDLGPYFGRREKKPELYQIIGVDVHLGESQNGGHYISYIRAFDTWYCLDDNEAMPLADGELPPFGKAVVLTLAKAEPPKAD